MHPLVCSTVCFVLRYYSSIGTLINLLYRNLSLVPLWYFNINMKKNTKPQGKAAVESEDRNLEHPTGLYPHLLRGPNSRFEDLNYLICKMGAGSYYETG